MNIELNKAVKAIQSGNVVGIPTETVYGIAADAFNVDAVEKTFRLKGRPSDNPLIVHICSTEQLHLLATEIPESVYPLTEKFWPGPLTLVLCKQPRVPDVVTGGLNTVAVRMPDHPLTLELIRRTGPLTAPSGNKSGLPSPTSASHLDDDYHGELPVLDGGKCTIGLESTVLDMTLSPPAILRPGAIDAAEILRKTGIVVSQIPQAEEDSSKSPGTRYSHYKPHASVQWMETTPESFPTDTYFIFHSFQPETKQKNIVTYSGNYQKLAQNLYDHFRTADRLRCQKVLIEPLPEPEEFHLITALTDRISKAVG